MIPSLYISSTLSLIEIELFSVAFILLDLSNKQPAVLMRVTIERYPAQLAGEPIADHRRTELRVERAEIGGIAQPGVAEPVL